MLVVIPLIRSSMFALSRVTTVLYGIVSDINICLFLSQTIGCGHRCLE